MAKSTRSKVKRSFRAKKRDEGVYAATEAARLNRLHQKLKMIASTDVEGDVPVDDVEVERADDKLTPEEEQPHVQAIGEGDGMEVDSGAAQSADSSKPISTHGTRGSRREQWREAKGLPPRARSRGMNRQGIPAAKRKSGRSQRRR